MRTPYRGGRIVTFNFSVCLRFCIALTATTTEISFVRPSEVQEISAEASEQNPDDLSADLVNTAVATEHDSPSDAKVVFGDWLGYNTAQSDTTWLAGGDFGMFSLESFPTLELGEDSALVVGTGFHFLDGPVAPDLPPRLFDFQIAYHVRKVVSRSTMFDVKLGVGAFSDFETSVRKGIRFPGHAVSYTGWSDQFVSVLGVDILDRDDISILPVAGVVLRPLEDLIFELIFPRPRIQMQLGNNRAMYVGGELGGGTWAIQRDDASRDNATYRDVRVTWGLMDFSKKSDSVLEIGWAFERELEYRSGVGAREFDGALILRFQSHF